MNTHQFHIVRLCHSLCLVFVFFLSVSVKAQSKVEAEFVSNYTVNQHFESRTNSAQATGEDDSSLAAKGYVKIGVVRSEMSTEQTSAEIAQTLRTAALRKAADGGGDIVRLERESVPGRTAIQTGKMKKVCTVSESGTRQSFQCSMRNHYSCQQTYIEYSRCEQSEEVPETKEIKVRVTEGTVWRQDPQLAARTVSIGPAKTKATVYVFRKHTIVGAVRTPAVYCDDVELAYTQNGRYFRVQLEPGEHYFRGEDDDDYTRIDLRPGEVGYIASIVGYSPHAKHAHAYVLVDPPEKAVPEIRSLKALDANKVVDRTRVAARGEIPDNPADLQ